MDPMRKIIIGVALTVIFLLLLVHLPLNIFRPVFHHDLIARYAAQYDIDPLLVTALIKVESNFFSRARSHRGAIGLMQLLPSTAQELATEVGYKHFTPNDLEKPEVNIHLGTYYLHKLIEAFDGNQVLALAAYNAGKNKVMNWYQEDPLVGIQAEDLPYRETREYVQNIMNTREWLRRLQFLARIFRRK